MNVREYLDSLENYFTKITEEKEIEYVDLYTKVQHIPKILPRLYKFILIDIY